ncbi:MAG: mannosyltransferase, partial [Candidatus Binatia bacterium]
MQWINIHLLALAALVARLVVIFVHDRVYHPDEIFQYLEQAHRLTFGYGYIPWEYRYGTRSWILPGFISGLLFVCRIFGVDDPAVYTTVVKVVFCILSVSLIYSVYIFAREIGGEAAGKLAAIFTCFWYELVYFAHKPLPELLSTYLIMA